MNERTPMKAVWKFTAPFIDVSEITTPRGAQILHIAAYNPGWLSVWALVDPEESRLVTRRLAIAGTGHRRADIVGRDHLGTVILNEGALVFHVFDLGEYPNWDAR